MCSNKLLDKLHLGLVLTKQSDCKERGGSVANSLQSVCITWERERSFVLYTQMFVLLLFPLRIHVLVFLLWPRQFISSHLGLEAGPGRTGRFVTVWHMECVNCDTAKGCYCRLKKGLWHLSPNQGQLWLRLWLQELALSWRSSFLTKVW